jgi:hypothetical protein
VQFFVVIRVDLLLCLLRKPQQNPNRFGKSDLGFLFALGGTLGSIFNFVEKDLISSVPF